jgi:hypothetical protein
VRTGITDGVMTEVSCQGLEAGTQVISGLEKADAAASSATTANPLQPQRSSGAAGAGRRAPGGF